MVNEDILTGLRNGVQRGETLQEAIQIMINSGYNPQEVEEASRFVAGNIPQNLEPKPNEQLVMPNEKTLLVQKNPLTKKNENIAKNEEIKQETDKIKSEILNKTESQTNKQSKTEKPKKSYLKEIILLVILLILLGILVTLIVFKDKILGWIS